MNIFYVDCGKKLCGYLDGLFQIYQMAMIGESTFKVSAEDSLHLVEALRYYCSIIINYRKINAYFTINPIIFAARL